MFAKSLISIASLVLYLFRSDLDQETSSWRDQQFQKDVTKPIGKHYRIQFHIINNILTA